MSTVHQSATNDRLAEAGLIVREAIAQAMKDLLGEQGAQATSFHIGVTEYEKEPKEFHVRLISMFHQGSEVIEKTIVKDLHKRLEIPLESRPVFNYEQSIAFAVKVIHERIVSERKHHHVQ